MPSQHCTVPGTYMCHKHLALMAGGYITQFLFTLANQRLTKSYGFVDIRIVVPMNLVGIDLQSLSLGPASLANSRTKLFWQNKTTSSKKTVYVLAILYVVSYGNPTSSSQARQKGSVTISTTEFLLFVHSC